MCIAIHKPANKRLPRKHAENSFSQNKDGAGFAYILDGQVFIEKGFMDFNSFWNAFEPHQNKEAVVHFRIATEGSVCAVNTHPFPLLDGALVHNGIIGIKATEGQTDTQTFCELVLAPLFREYGDSLAEHPAFRFLVHKSIGWSKIVWLRPSGAVFFRKEEGIMRKGIWYSNSTFKEPKVEVYSRCADWPPVKGEKNLRLISARNLGDAEYYAGDEDDCSFPNGKRIRTRVDVESEMATAEYCLDRARTEGNKDEMARLNMEIDALEAEWEDLLEEEEYYAVM